MILTDSSDLALGNTSAGTLRTQAQPPRRPHRGRRRRRRRNRPVPRSGPIPGPGAQAAGRRQPRLPVRPEPRRPGDQGDHRLVSRSEPAALRGHRRRRRRHPVLPVPGPEPARPGIRLRPTGPQRLGLGGQPPQRLRPQPGRVRGRRPWSPCARAISRSRDSPSAGWSRRRRRSPGSSTNTSAPTAS